LKNIFKIIYDFKIIKKFKNLRNDLRHYIKM